MVKLTYMIILYFMLVFSVHVYVWQFKFAFYKDTFLALLLDDFKPLNVFRLHIAMYTCQFIDLLIDVNGMLLCLGLF